jgi:hypothetical protein
MVTAADKLHAAKPGSRRAERALQRLRKLARLASANDITAVRARVARTARIAELVMSAADPAAAGDHVHAPVPHHQGSGRASSSGSPVSGEGGGASPGAASEVLDETAPFHPDPPAGVPGNGTGSVEHEPEAGASRDGGREAAQRVYRDSVRKGRPLSSRDVARIAGCSPTTAWRATRAVRQAETSDAASPNGAGPAAGGTSTDTDALVKA